VRVPDTGVDPVAWTRGVLQLSLCSKLIEVDLGNGVPVEGNRKYTLLLAPGAVHRDELNETLADEIRLE
jgi:hypothetical protein